MVSFNLSECCLLCEGRLLSMIVCVCVCVCMLASHGVRYIGMCGVSLFKISNMGCSQPVSIFDCASCNFAIFIQRLSCHFNQILNVLIISMKINRCIFYHSILACCNVVGCPDTPLP
jgi:hypothetical protein